jgi:transposase
MPPWRTVYGWFRRWAGLGLFERMMRDLTRLKGFAILPRRRVVERSFGWLTHRGGLLRDRAGRLDVSAAPIACAAVLASTEALINPA